MFPFGRGEYSLHRTQASYNAFMQLVLSLFSIELALELNVKHYDAEVRSKE